MAKKELLIVTGMSGAGKTVTMGSLEDLGYFTAQNIPAEMLPKVWDLISGDENVERAAIMIDARSGNFFSELEAEVERMREANHNDYELKILFLDASDHELVARYKETRRAHPLAANKSVLAGIAKERRMLDDVKKLATRVISTDEFSAKELRQAIFERYGTDEDKKAAFNVQVMSFGFKYGLPADADMVMDVRFLDNPYYLEELRPQTGLDAPVADYVWDNDDAQTYYQRVQQSIEWLLPRYKAEGKSNVTIAFGCTGGQHRSVAFTHRLSEQLKQSGYAVNEYHRDIERRKRS
ncbi:RNase adapter RapZ [Weissella ceti]|uniref:RNase adapter RapZ n=1 Tax=Weissella ceti TaxID=759620 RepID=A0ABT3E5X6_9LACO|nr:RNase adapter RapZ [Weissella ceti]MCW0953785.1 RNase adapter RapZ [Weissella ceti]QVK11870.1 RNase adapter RapZ [Weissella ceti]